MNMDSLFIYNLTSGKRERIVDENKYKDEEEPNKITFVSIFSKTVEDGKGGKMVKRWLYTVGNKGDVRVVSIEEKPEVRFKEILFWKTGENEINSLL